ncbi:MAG TPA: tRNA (adenosine(37)-N6)-threonylcarbamoyltransferase complex dimerization subunit type 1 TsaB [Myxococcales bacterium]|nr:tRNA (adenosine(37)-N6)-threonylcarbamoyltransferase complex dimerization subunit type 1 TsaB [Myxococcales bacterium]
MGKICCLAGYGTLSSSLGPGEEPLCLALETATATASVALLRGERVLAVDQSPDGQHHSETLLPMIDGILSAGGYRLEAIDLFAVSIGPGAFTSLRIGLATLKGLAFGSARPAVAVSTLQALALTACRALPALAPGMLVPTLDARRGEVYAAAYSRAALAGDLGALTPRVAESVYGPGELARALPEGGTLVGEGARVVAPELIAGEPGGWRVDYASPGVPDAVAVGLLGLAGAAQGRGCPAGDLVPRYVRRAEAEVTRTAQSLEPN